MFNLENHITYRVYHLQKSLKRKLNVLFDNFDISFEQFEILNCLLKQDGIIQKELSGRIDKDQATLTRMLGILNKKGYIERRNSNKDKRVCEIYLTEKGFAEATEILEKLEEMNTALMDKLKIGNDGMIAINALKHMDHMVVIM